MERYMISVVLNIEVEAFSESDALDAVHDTFGEGSTCGLNVVDYEVTDHDRLE
jgi:hypothetical protein